MSGSLGVRSAFRVPRSAFRKQPYSCSAFRNADQEGVKGGAKINCLGVTRSSQVSISTTGEAS